MSEQTPRGDDSPLIRDTLDSPGERFADTTVIDVDVHITYTEELQRKAASKMPKPWDDYTNPDSVARGEVSSRPLPGINMTLGGRKNRLVADAGDPETVHRDLCEGLGIDHPVINTAGVDGIWTPERATEEMRAINDVLIEEFLDEYDEFLGAGTITLRDPAASAEEIDRLGKEDQMVAAYISSGSSDYQKPPGDPEYDIIYQAMEDNDITPFYHVSTFTEGAPWLYKFKTAFAWHSLGLPWSIQQALVSLIAQGTPEKFPDLDFFMIEGGIEWVPFLMGRLNREYAQWLPEVSILEKKPEEYIRDQFYFSTQPIGEMMNPEHTKEIIDIIGMDSLVFATDYPHYDFDNPSTIDTLVEDASPEDREKLYHGNAAEAFGLDL